MSSKSEKKDYEDLLDYGVLNEEPLNLKLAILSFKNFSKEVNFIYDGLEKMPFYRRHPTYQSIFRNEFTDITKNQSKKSFNTYLTF